MKTTEQQREELEALELQLMDNMSSISKDFAFDYRADCGAWVCDAFTEYADIIKSEGLTALCAKAAVCAMYEKNYSQLEADRENILKCILINWLTHEGKDAELLVNPFEALDAISDNLFDIERICDILEGLAA